MRRLAMERRQFLKQGSVAAAALSTGSLGLLGAACSEQAETQPAVSDAPHAQEGIYVPSGEDRFNEKVRIWGIIPHEVKVASRDTGGNLFVFEHNGMGKGGPPRHLHLEQDEWFFVREGEFAFEVGEKAYTLNPGDSLFAPRMVPHVWAHVGNTPGTLLLAVQPAGTMEEFFRASVRMTAPPTPQEAEAMFAAHGMKVVGPPLNVG